LKQPWAALVVQGLKSIEIRRWPTPRRGRILIHASKLPDQRPEAWAWVPAEVQPLAKLCGGIIGAAELTGCIEYRAADLFAADRRLHFNEPSWFRPPVMYGFVFTKAEIVAFRSLLGYVKIFPVLEPRQ